MVNGCQLLTVDCGLPFPSQRRFLHHSRTRHHAKSISPAQQPIRQCAASARRQRRRSRSSSALHRRGRRSKRYRRRRQRSHILRIRPPVQRLVPQLHVQIPRRAQEIYTWRRKRRRHIGLRKIKKPGPRHRRVCNCQVKPTVRCLHLQRRNRRRCRRRIRRVHAGIRARRIHRRNNLHQRLVQIRVPIFHRRQLRNRQHSSSSCGTGTPACVLGFLFSVNSVLFLCALCVKSFL